MLNSAGEGRSRNRGSLCLTVMLFSVKLLSALWSRVTDGAKNQTNYNNKNSLWRSPQLINCLRSLIFTLYLISVMLLRWSIWQSVVSCRCKFPAGDSFFFQSAGSTRDNNEAFLHNLEWTVLNSIPKSWIYCLVCLSAKSPDRKLQSCFRYEISCWYFTTSFESFWLHFQMKEISLKLNLFYSHDTNYLLEESVRRLSENSNNYLADISAEITWTWLLL